MGLGPSKTTEHEPNHGQIDHGFAGPGLAFVVAGEPAGAAEPSKSTFHDPTARQNFERVQVGAFHNFDGAAPKLARLFEQRTGIAAVGPDMAGQRPLALTEAIIVFPALLAIIPFAQHRGGMTFGHLEAPLKHATLRNSSATVICESGWPVLIVAALLLMPALVGMMPVPPRKSRILPRRSKWFRTATSPVPPAA